MAELRTINVILRDEKMAVILAEAFRLMNDHLDFTVGEESVAVVPLSEIVLVCDAANQVSP